MTLPVRFVLGEALKCEETRHVEFKEVKAPNPFSSISNTADEYAVAFLNSEGGRIYWGVRDNDKLVVGVEISEPDRDRLRQIVFGKLSEIQPQLDPGRFKLKLHPVVNGSADLVVVELEVPAGNSERPFYTGGHACFVRLDGVKKKLSGQQLTDWILTRMEPRRAPPDSEAVDQAMLELARRVRRIFSGHGLLPAHLARFFELRKAPFTITLVDQQNDANFLRWLDEPKIAWIAETFGIRREWIDGEDDDVHERCSYDKDPVRFLAEISKHTGQFIYEEKLGAPEAWFLRFGVDNDWEQKGHHGVFVVVRVPLAHMSNETTIFRYLSDFEPYRWTEGRTAVQLRAWARLLHINKKIPCIGRSVRYEAGQDIWGNSVLLHEILASRELVQHCRDDWHPEDYALHPEESVIAKPDTFLPQVIEFLKRHDLPNGNTGRSAR